MSPDYESMDGWVNPLIRSESLLSVTSQRYTCLWTLGIKTKHSRFEKDIYPNQDKHMDKVLYENFCYFPILQMGEWRPTKVKSFAHGEWISHTRSRDWHPDLHGARAHSLNPLWKPDSKWNVGLLWSGLYQLHHLESPDLLKICVPAIHASLLSFTFWYFASQHPRLEPCRMWAIWE